MALEELAAIPRDWLTCAQIAPVLGADASDIHDQTIQDPRMLGFPVVVVKSRVKIPKKPFIRFMSEGLQDA